MDMDPVRLQCRQNIIAPRQEILTQGTIVVEGLLPYSSNYTLLVWVEHQGNTIRAVYKPCRGERPLWDFPQGTLYRREVAAYIVSEALGFYFVPPTIVCDGPFGIGALQLFMDHDPEAHILTMIRENIYDEDLLRLAAFDYLINNADRKSGHALKGRDGCLWAIDHGICFHEEIKLRTILWDFVGLPLPPDVIQALQAFKKELLHPEHLCMQQLSQLLDRDEIEALRQRLNALLRSGFYPEPGVGMNIPWPPV